MDQAKLCNFYSILGASFGDILYFVAQIHGKCVSARMLNRHLHASSKQSFECQELCTVLSAAEFIKQVTKEHICIYKHKPTLDWMVRECNSRVVKLPKQTIEILMEILDPEKSETCLRRNIRRSGSIGPGPDYIWHISTFCAFEEYGFFVHFCVDGFSRKIIFSDVSDTKCHFWFYRKIVENQNGYPLLLKVHTDLSKSSRGITGRLWRFISNASLQDLSELFYHRRQNCDGHAKIQTLQAYFSRHIEDEIMLLKKQWNTQLLHLNHRHIAFGRPAVLYTFPVLYGTRSYLQPIQL